MPALKKILCALDLSDQSESVAEYAVMLAKMSGASIVAVYAAPVHGFPCAAEYHRQLCR